MTRKQWAIFTLALLLSALALIIGAVVVIDPFEVYHQATAFIPPIVNGTQIYSNAGVAKSYAYDSVVIGSSMTENFRPSFLSSRLGGQFVKLCINAGSPYNHRQMMEMAFGTHSIQRVIYGVDVELFTYFYNQPKCEMPDYLYDDNPFNDVRYWFNMSVLTRYIPECLSTLGQHDDAQRDTMYAWGDLYEYGLDAMLGGINLQSGRVAQRDERNAEPTLSQATRLNVEHNILPFIAAHPDTEFIFFFPPYSLARWYGFYTEGMLSYHLNQKEAIAKALLAFDNVRVFDFQARTDWITNPDNYIDSGHYGPWINDAMAEAFADDSCRITSAAQAQENDAEIERLVLKLADAGRWTDAL